MSFLSQVMLEVFSCLKKEFFLLTVAKCLLIGAHLIVGVFSPILHFPCTINSASCELVQYK